MPISIIDCGANNTVNIDPEYLARCEGTIELSDSGNVVSVAPPARFGMLSIRVGDGAKVLIGPRCGLSNLYLDAPRGATISIGADNWFNGSVGIRADEDRGVTIGDGCLIADEVKIWSSDMHSVIDVTTRRRVNPAREIVIGDRVWLGFRALVLKGSQIGAGAILGAGAVLSGEVPANCVSAGNPASVVKRGVTWDHPLLPVRETDGVMVKPRPRSSAHTARWPMRIPTR